MENPFAKAHRILKDMPIMASDKQSYMDIEAARQLALYSLRIVALVDETFKDRPDDALMGVDDWIEVKMVCKSEEAINNEKAET